MKNMKKNEKWLSIGNLQHFATPTFDPANVLISDFKTGSIPTEHASGIVSNTMHGSAVMKLAKYEPMTTLKKKFQFWGEGLAAYWVSEAEKIKTSKPTLIDAEMEAKKLAVIVVASKEFLNYTMTNFFNEMKPKIAEAFAKKFDAAALWGTDSPYAAGQSIWADIQASGNSMALDSDNVYASLNGLMAFIEDEDGEIDGFVTKKGNKRIFRGAVDTNGRPLFNEAAGAPNDLLGEVVSYVPKGAWDDSKAVVLAGDWDFARYGILQDIQYAISTEGVIDTIENPDGTPVNLFTQDLIALRATMHVGFMRLKEGNFAALTPDVTP